MQSWYLGRFPTHGETFMLFRQEIFLYFCYTQIYEQNQCTKQCPAVLSDGVINKPIIFQLLEYELHIAKINKPANLVFYWLLIILLFSEKDRSTIVVYAQEVWHVVSSNGFMCLMVNIITEFTLCVENYIHQRR